MNKFKNKEPKPRDVNGDIITPIIKSSKVSLSFANADKLIQLDVFITEYQSLVSQYVDQMWLRDDIKSLIDSSYQVKTWLSARMQQCAGKQASGIVRGTRKKQTKRLFIIEKLNNEGQFKKARKLQKIYDEAKISKPDIKVVNPELDSRFIKTDIENTTTFDGLLEIDSIGNKVNIVLPFKKTKHYNELAAKGKLKKGIRISSKYITFIFELPHVPKKTSGIILGIDIGSKTLLSISDGNISKKNKDGYDVDSILDILIRKKIGSIGFDKAKAHLDNYVKWSINQLDLSGVKEIRLERLFKLPKVSKKLKHWVYPLIMSIIGSKCIEHGVHVKYISPTYTSQRCSKCGWVRKTNRKGKLFKCDKCGFEHDADLNAALNISLELKPIGKKQRLKRLNIKGFYWDTFSSDNIVPNTQKANGIVFNT